MVNLISLTCEKGVLMNYKLDRFNMTIIDIIKEPSVYLNKDSIKSHTLNFKNSISTSDLREYEESKAYNDGIIYIKYLKPIAVKDLSSYLIRDSLYGKVTLTEVMNCLDFLSKAKKINLYIIDADELKHIIEYNKENKLNKYDLIDYRCHIDDTSSRTYISLYGFILKAYFYLKKLCQYDCEELGLNNKDVKRHYYNKLEEYCDYVVNNIQYTPLSIFTEQAYAFSEYCILSSNTLTEAECLDMLKSRLSVLPGISAVIILLANLINMNYRKFRLIDHLFIKTTLSLYTPLEWREIWLIPCYETASTRDIKAINLGKRLISISLLSKYLRSAQKEEEYKICLQDLNNIVEHLESEFHNDIAESILLSKSMPGLINTIQNESDKYSALAKILVSFEITKTGFFEKVCCILQITETTEIDWYLFLKNRISRKLQLKLLEVAVDVRNNTLAQYIYNDFPISQQTNMNRTIKSFMQSA